MSNANPESKKFLAGRPVHDHIENHEHVSPPWLYLAVLGGLLFLTVMTYLVSFADLGPASLPVALVVAFMKAALVCTFFMHLKYDEPFHAFIFVSSLLFVAIFFIFILFDLRSREALTEVQGTFYRRDSGDWNDRTYVRKPPPRPAASASAAGAQGDLPVPTEMDAPEPANGEGAAVEGSASGATAEGADAGVEGGAQAEAEDTDDADAVEEDAADEDRAGGDRDAAEGGEEDEDVE